MAITEPRGHLALPATGKGPGVLVLHAWWGLNDTIKGICERLAHEGNVVFAPDLYHGKVATTIEEAGTLSHLDADRAGAEIVAAVDFLLERAGDEGRAIAVVGFSLGAYFALKLSVDDAARVRSVVVFYGTGPVAFAKSQAAYLGHFAENDDFEPAAEVHALEAVLRAAGRPVTFHTYPGTGHWFFEPDRTDAYDEEAAQLAWRRTIAFLHEQHG
jgi:carboxymethylenebutenolidase